MEVSEIQRQLQEANPEWEITVSPVGDDPLNMAPIVISARHRADGRTWESPSYDRPQMAADSLARWISQDLARL